MFIKLKISEIQIQLAHFYAPSSLSTAAVRSFVGKAISIPLKLGLLSNRIKQNAFDCILAFLKRIKLYRKHFGQLSHVCLVVTSVLYKCNISLNNSFILHRCIFLKNQHLPLGFISKYVLRSSFSTEQGSIISVHGNEVWIQIRLKTLDHSFNQVSFEHVNLHCADPQGLELDIF